MDDNYFCRLDSVFLGIKSLGDNMVTISSGSNIFSYTFDSYHEAFKRFAKWFEDGLVSEEECMGFVIEMFHQIPEGVYNRLAEKL